MLKCMIIFCLIGINAVIWAQGNKSAILYTVQPKGDIHQLYIINSDGTGNRKVTTNSMGMNHAEWSPDGRKIVTIGYLDKSYNTCSVFTLNEDGTDIKRLTSTENVTDFDPVYSPDGKQIIFTRILPITINGVKDSKYEMWLMNADGTGQHYLGLEGFQPKFSPDGKKILYRAKYKDKWEINICNYDCSNIRRITDNNFDEVNPSWSPDGKLIAFDCTINGNNDIYIINSDGTGLKRITEYSGWDLYPKWSPDGSSFLFVSDRDEKNHWEVYTMDINGKNIKRVTHTSGSDTAINPAWKPIK